MSDTHGKNVRRRRPQDEWSYRFVISDEEYTGPCFTTNKAQAQKIAAEKKREAQVTAKRQRKLGIGPMTFGMACYKWFKKVGKHSSETDIKTQVRWLRDTIGGDTLVQDIRKEAVSDLKEKRAKMMTGGSIRRRIKPSQVNKYLRRLQQILLFARDELNVDIPPFSIATFYLEQRKEPKRKITPVEEVRLFEAADEDEAVLIEFGNISGFRISQIISLRKDQCDITNRQYLGIKEKFSKRNAEMSEAERAIILSRWNDHPEFVFTRVAKRTRAYGRGSSERFYVKGERYPFVYTGLEPRWRKLVAATGVKGATLHSMRHTAGTRTLAVSELAVARDTLGHADAKITEIYTEVSPGKVAEAKDRAAAAARVEREKVGAKVGAKTIQELQVVGRKR